jgi:hypothetical protein
VFWIDDDLAATQTVVAGFQAPLSLTVEERVAFAALAK